MATEQAIIAATHLIEDRNGADYYQDTGVLTKYLEGALGLRAEEAELKAKAIQKDRGGANYYADPEILARYLS